MVKRILVDAVHPEETRVAVADEAKLIEFDFETLERKQIKSNIYLGKITRVEPSLQAAFVEYGGNRQGFLPFSEIHYDYYQIPTEDKEKLAAAIRAEVEKVERQEENEFHEEERRLKEAEAKKNGVELPAEPAAEVVTEVTAVQTQNLTPEEIEAALKAEELEKQFALEIMGEEYVTEKYGDISLTEPQDEVGAALDDNFTSRSDFYKQYKIQEVIKRNQIVLIQVVKEERGNKGASLTTYVAIPGRFCVFMPNTEKGGGVSRRIASYSDRKRMRDVLKQMEIPKGTSAIMRTAGVDKEVTEIKHDLDYLISLWNNIRAQTLESTAPSLIYEESDIVKRSLRDLFRSDVNEIIIEGDQAYNSTIQFMEIVAPNQKAIVKKHSGKQPIFDQYRIEDQLDELYEPTSKLESGGYVVITPTEALVSIDVNSGKATRERNIEDTAYRTNIEAAREIARQLRLRDLAGLVVIDFIDMRDVRNRKAVERELKEALKSDRAKIQVGRISPFGLLEMSRQRLRSSIVESSSVTCPMCKGLGVVRSNESVTLKILRAIEAEASKNNTREIRVDAAFDVAFSILNKKRDEIKALEEKEDVRIYINGTHDLLPNQYKIDSVRGRNKRDFQGGQSNELDHVHSHSHNSESGEQPVREAREPREPREPRAPRERRDDRHKAPNLAQPQANYNQEIPEYILNEEGQDANYEQNFNSLDENRGPRNNRRPNNPNGPRNNNRNKDRNFRNGPRERTNDKDRGEIGNRETTPREGNSVQGAPREGGMREGSRGPRNRRNRRGGGGGSGEYGNGNREFNGNSNGNYESGPNFEPINDNSGFNSQAPKQASYAKYSEPANPGFDASFSGDEKSQAPASKLKGLWKKITS